MVLYCTSCKFVSVVMEKMFLLISMLKLGLGEKVKSFSHLMTGSDMEVTEINISLQRLDNSEFDYTF